MRFLIIIIRQYPRRSALTLICLLFASVAEGVGLLMLLPVLSVATDNQTRETGSHLFGAEQFLRQALSVVGLTPTVGTLLILIILCVAVKSAFTLLAKIQVGYTVTHVATGLRLSLLQTLLATRWEYYVRQPVGSLANAVGTEAMRAALAYLEGAKGVTLFVEAIVYAGVAFVVAGKATLTFLVPGVLILYGLNYLVRMAHQAGTRQTRLLKSLVAGLTDSLQSIKPLKAMAREELIGPSLQSSTRRLNRAVQRDVLSTEALSSSQDLGLAIVVAVGLYLALSRWNMPLNAVMVMVLLLARMLTCLAKTQRQYQKMRTFESAFWSLRAAIDGANRDRETEPGGASPSLERSLRLDKVSFGYDKQWVLRNASLTIPAGSFTVIIGPSGAGKTTVADLFTGLLRPQQGCVWVDDLPLDQIDLRQWRRMIGYVPQEPFLLHDTVLQNVTLGDPELNEADAEAALRAAGAWDFVMAQPSGIHGSVGERGTALSGGQRQRIAIARALVHRPKLLILDEVTSALDQENTATICRTLRGLRGQLTIVAISHESAVVESGDRVYRIHKGEASLVTNGCDSDVVFSGSVKQSQR
ncbi:MAG TPA: ATP-binding cassette domain-containing protein [Patescibacteria group bacterium]|nr:ATP-binding cassette domain-containing protein [Patescibacteria group bacterium]